MLDMINHRHEDCSGCAQDWWRWVRINISKPISGFDEKKNPDGSPFSLAQQRSETHAQMYWIIRDLCARRKSSGSIQSTIAAFL